MISVPDDITDTARLFRWLLSLAEVDGGICRIKILCGAELADRCFAMATVRRRTPPDDDEPVDMPDLKYAKVGFFLHLPSGFECECRRKMLADEAEGRCDCQFERKA